MYPKEFVEPARRELTELGIQELRTASDVDEVLGKEKGSILVVVNSVCGCAAANARPAVARALNEAANPDLSTSVFAGQDQEATQRAREYFRPQPPSSPSIALMNNGRLVFMLHRQQIEGRSSDAIANDLIEALNTYCAREKV